MVFDDGVVLRLGAEHFLTTTTTGNAAAVLDWLEEWLQTEWPQLDVTLTSVTDHWAVAAVAGPRARDVLRALTDPELAFMTVRETEVAGAGARLCRVSFSGELAYEVHVRRRDAHAVWEALLRAGEPYGITPYGTEAMHVLRAEKGYPIVGQDTDGTVTPQDLGMGWVVSKTKPFFVGRRSHERPDTCRDDRRQLVGLLPHDPGERLVEGAALLSDPDGRRGEGHVTSSYRSAALGRTFALALLERGRARHGETIHVTTAAGATTPARVTGTVFYDPDGRRRDGDD
jgi:sarcosine oxidase subunit alpha